MKRTIHREKKIPEVDFWVVQCMTTDKKAEYIHISARLLILYENFNNNLSHDIYSFIK